MTAATITRHHPLNNRSGAPKAEDLIRDGVRILRAGRIEYAPSWLPRMARAYQSSGTWREQGFAYFLAERMNLSRQEMHSFLAYSDPTGETAVRNVMCGGDRSGVDA